MARTGRRGWSIGHADNGPPGGYLPIRLASFALNLETRRG